MSAPHSLLTPVMRQLIERMSRVSRQPLHAMTPSQARAVYEVGAGMLEMAPRQLARVQELLIPTRDAQHIAARLYAPSNEVLPALVFFHGGGFVIGSVATHDTLCRNLSHLAQCAVVSVDYRLAPEYKFPVAANDAWDSVQWIAANAASLGLDSTRLAVGGDSAGGTLAAACAIEARDAELPLALQVLFYPGCAAHADTDSHKTFGKGFVLEDVHIEYFFSLYTQQIEEREDWRFAPLMAPDVANVAPAWIGLAECDPLVDEGVLYGDKLRLAGVPVSLEIYRGVVHEFIKMGRAIPEALQAQTDAAQALRNAFHLTN